MWYWPWWHPYHHKLRGPRCVRLYLRRNVRMGPTVSWFKDPSPVVSGYLVYWTHNGTLIAPVAVPQTAQGDVGGYSLDFGSSDPTITVQPGDVVGAAVASVSAKFNLQSPQIVSVLPWCPYPLSSTCSPRRSWRPYRGPTAVTLVP